MANQNGAKYGFTGLFPIKTDGHSAKLRTLLRSLDNKRSYPSGSPLSNVPIVHMARFVIIDGLPYQGAPAKLDTLKSHYLLFACDFDGYSVDTLIHAMVGKMPEVTAIWDHCVGFPGTDSLDRLTAYFEQCQLKTNLLLADQPETSVDDILKGLMYRRRLGEFIRQVQNQPPGPTALQRDFMLMWRSLQNDKPPLPGDL